MTPAPSAAPAATPDAALTARFTAFFADILASRVPATGLSAAMKAALTPDAVSAVAASFAPFGTFTRLQYAGQDSRAGYERYRYTAIFDKGSQGLLFVLDSDGNIAGFFKSQ